MSNSDSAPKKNTWPIFVISSMRSGSTLFRYLLNTHRQISCPPESRFLEPLKEFLEHPDFIVASINSGCHPDELRQTIKQFIESVLGRQAVLAGKRRWADKSPNYYTILPFLDQLYEKRVFYLFLVRHPLDSVSSLEEFLANASKYHPDREMARIAKTFGTDKYGCAKYWVDVYQRITFFKESVQERGLVIRYEELVQRPQEIMSRVTSFVGEDPTLLELQNTFKSKTSGAQDYKFLGTHQVHSSSVGRWKRWAPNESRLIWELVSSVALPFGYFGP